jgi:uncharacterized membrane protein YdfJ with MMPL/SSD domain
VPSILAILGPWFWWPTVVRRRPSDPLPGPGGSAEPVTQPVPVGKP